MCVEVLLSGLFSLSPVRDEPVPLFGGLASFLVSRFVRRISHRKRILSSPVNLRLLSGQEISRFGALHRHWVGGRVEGGSATLTQPMESAPLYGRPSHALFTLPVGTSPKLTVIVRDLAPGLPVSAKGSDYSEERARGMMYISPCSVRSWVSAPCTERVEGRETRRCKVGLLAVRRVSVGGPELDLIAQLGGDLEHQEREL